MKQNKSTIMRAAVWAAVSSKTQAADDKISIPMQLQLGHEHAEKHKWHVTHELVVDGKSRSITELHIAMERVTGYQVVGGIRSDCRPYQVLRDLIVSRSIEVLVYYDMDRLGRSTVLGQTVVQLCRDYGIAYYEIFSPEAIDAQNTESAMYMSAFKSIRSRVYVMRLVQARADGMMKRVKSGKFPHSVPWGWIRRYNPDGSFVDIINEDARHYYRLAFCELYMQGQPLSAIAKALNDAGSRSPDGHLWTKYMLTGLLNIIWRHAGYSEINRRSKMGREHILSPGNWPAIITKDEAEQIIAERDRRAASKRMVTAPSLFSGVVICERCGTNMNYNANGIMRCYHRYQHGAHKDGTTLLAHVLVRTVMDAITADFTSLQDEEIRAEIISSLDIQSDVDTQNRMAALDAQLKRIEESRDKDAVDFYVDRAYSTTAHNAIVAELDRRQKAIEQQRAKLQQQINENKSMQHIDATLCDLAQNGLAMLNNPDTRLANAWLLRRIRIYALDNRVNKIVYLSL